MLCVCVCVCVCLTLEDGAYVPPDGDAAAAVELSQRQLHVEERHAPEHRHQQVGQEERTWGGGQGRSGRM